MRGVAGRGEEGWWGVGGVTGVVGMKCVELGEIWCLVGSLGGSG